MGSALDLPAPECPLGYPEWQVRAIVADLDAFNRWMRGQTVVLCEGRRYDYGRGEYVADDCAGHPHGLVTYAWDVRRFLARAS